MTDIENATVSSTADPNAGVSLREAAAADDHWYLAQLKPGGFARARENLERQGFASFMPMLEVTRQRLGQFTTRQVPLFAGYLFVRVPPEASGWRVINSTYGVARLVALHGGYPTPVPAELIAGLRGRCDNRSRLMPPARFEVGAAVRVVAGPFASTLATIESADEAGRVWILMDLMGQKVRTAVKTDVLQLG